MARVFLHTRPQGDHRSQDTAGDFGRVPVVGEYIAPGPTSAWYRVCLVVHVPFPAEYEAEVYAIEVEHDAVLSEEWLQVPAAQDLDSTAIEDAG